MNEIYQLKFEQVTIEHVLVKIKIKSKLYVDFLVPTGNNQFLN